MSLEKLTQLALELQKLGVSQDGATELLLNHPVDVIEAQLSFMPFRKAKRPEAFIVEAIRKNYSPPNNFYYAKAKADLTAAINAVDPGPQRSVRQVAAIAQRHGTENPLGPHSQNERLEPGRAIDPDYLPNPLEPNRETI